MTPFFNQRMRIISSFLLCSTILVLGYSAKFNEKISAKINSQEEQELAVSSDSVLLMTEGLLADELGAETSPTSSEIELANSSEESTINESQETTEHSSNNSLISSSSNEVSSSNQPLLVLPNSSDTSVTTNPIQKVLEVTQEKVTQNEEETESPQFNFSKNQTTTEFIQAIGADAQKIAQKSNLYASVMIAQAILETGSGNSSLARPPHYNLFGIKGAYEGKKIKMATSEDNGHGKLYTIQADFRAYPSYKESLEDYAILLKGGISGNQRFYQSTWKSEAKSYKEATAYLTGRYATDRYYDQKLNALIETYDLARYDQAISVSQKEPLEGDSVENKDSYTKKNVGKSEEFLLEGMQEEPKKIGITTHYAQQRVPLPSDEKNWVDQPVKEVSGKQVIQ